MKTIYFLVTGLLITVNTAAQDMAAKSENDDLPVVGVRYYYYPNLDAYFDTHENLYIYEQKGQWVKAPQIASGYRGYSLYNNTRFEVTDYNGDEPFTKLSDHRKQFPKKFASKRLPPSKTMQNDTKVAYN